MALLVKDVLGHVNHELGKDLSEKISALSVVNMAGEHIVGMRAWTWLQRPAVTLGFQAGVEFVTLPDDFGDMRALYAYDSLNNIARFVGEDDVALLNATALGNISNVFFISLVSAASGYYLDKPPVKQFHVYHAPTITVPNALRLVYRARWPRRTDDNQYIPIDPSCDLLFIEIARQIAQGFQTSHAATASDRLTKLMMGATYLAASAFDIRNIPAMQPRPLRGMHLIWPVPKVTH